MKVQEEKEDERERERERDRREWQLIWNQFGNVERK